jgi:hypothetical protein
MPEKIVTFEFDLSGEITIADTVNGGTINVPVNPRHPVDSLADGAGEMPLRRRCPEKNLCDGGVGGMAESMKLVYLSLYCGRNDCPYFQ